jgi:8-oxo-dGTP pyrophosphatase MutT (NUDIX family)
MAWYTSEPPVWAVAIVVEVQPDGPFDVDVDAVVVTDGDRPAAVTLMAPGWRPPNEQITQSYGICFTNDGGVVLVAVPPVGWNLPGGTIERGESAEDALIREVAEEACATVVDYQYIASQHVWDPDSPSGQCSYYQSRWWARVRVDVWKPHYETVDRVIVRPEAVCETLYWSEKTIARRLLGLAIDIERDFRSR